MFEVQNQPPPLDPYNLFGSDIVLREAVRRENAEWAEGALNALEKQHEGYPLIQNEIVAAKQGVFDQIIKRFKEQAAPTPDLVPFVQRLIQYTWTKGPKVEIRFQPKYIQNYEHIEDIVADLDQALAAA